MNEHPWHSVVSLVLKLILAGLAIVTLIKTEYVWFIGTVFALFLTIVPSILAKDFYVKLPIIFDAAITISIFFHVVGGYVDFYEIIPYYDHFTHFLTSATISLIGVTLLYIIVYCLKVTQLPPHFFGFFTVLFTISMGVIWEFMEWGSDLAFGTQLQRGLNDTMLDLSFDTMAGVIVGIIATIRLKQGDVPEMEQVIVGDLQESAGYKRWQLLRDKDKTLSEKIKIAFKDPIVIGGFFDYVVKESKHITDAEEKVWHGLKIKGRKLRKEVTEKIEGCCEDDESKKEKASR